MKIENTPKGVGASRIQEIDRAKKTQTGVVRKDTAGLDDSVDLTAAAAELQRLESMLANVEIVDIEKVEAVRRAIAEDRFRVDGETIAERLIESVLEGLRSSHRS